MTHPAQTAFLAAGLVLTALSASPSGAAPGTDNTRYAAQQAQQLIAPSPHAPTYGPPKTVRLAEPGVIRIAAGPTRRPKRFVVKRPRNTSARQVQTRRVLQGGNNSFTTGQGRAPQADGTFDSQDLIQVFSAGEYND